MREARTIIEPIAAWFDRNARDLPWRRRRSGYRALVSEAMLQQTQVSRVVERFNVFIKRFPTVRALADADVQDVLAVWQGLGYYRRARHLHRAAQVIVAEHGGRVPRDVRTLAALPGVGRYTAGAIASIVYNRREPIVDGNVRRVLIRLYAHDAPDDRAADAWAWTTAGRLVAEATRPGAFNEGLMELGATVCTPRAPRCAACPVRNACQALARGVHLRMPPPKQTAERLALHHHAVVIRRGRRALIEQRPPTGLWADLWQPPTIETDRAITLPGITDALPVPVTNLTRVSTITATLTHRRIHISVYSARSRSRAGRWVDVDELATVPLGSAQRRVFDAAGGVGGGAGGDAGVASVADGRVTAARSR